MRAWLNLRHSVPERARAFQTGLSKHGYSIASGCTSNPGPKDIFVSWGRIGHDAQHTARVFEDRGLPVLIAENSTWGNSFAGQNWYTIARNRHNTKGMFPVGDNERFDSLGVELKPFRTEGETVILAQRGIGEPPTAMPRDWPSQALAKHGGRIRPHPGNGPAPIPLSEDLANCGRAITWGSGSAISALVMGIPVISEMPDWIGQQDNSEAGRLEMFRALAWAQWRLQEIRSGFTFERLLK